MYSYLRVCSHRHPAFLSAPVIRPVLGIRLASGEMSNVKSVEDINALIEKHTEDNNGLLHPHASLFFSLHRKGYSRSFGVHERARHQPNSSNIQADYGFL